MITAVPTRKRAAPGTPAQLFDLRVFLDSAGIARTVRKCARSAVVFSQGDPANDVLYVQDGRVKLSVLSKTSLGRAASRVRRAEWQPPRR